MKTVSVQIAPVDIGTIKALTVFTHFLLGFIEFQFKWRNHCTILPNPKSSFIPDMGGLIVPLHGDDERGRVNE